jgi:hypothetical protein
MKIPTFAGPAPVTCSNAVPVSSATVGNEECSSKVAEGVTPVYESRDPQCAHCGQRGGHLIHCPFK